MLHVDLTESYLLMVLDKDVVLAEESECFYQFVGCSILRSSALTELKLVNEVFKTRHRLPLFVQVLMVGNPLCGSRVRRADGHEEVLVVRYHC